VQFRRWAFPSKQNPAHKNDRLVARIRELWEKNYTQANMLRILRDDGFDIKQRELMRVRTRNRWLLRMPNPSKTSVPDNAVVAPQDAHLDHALNRGSSVGEGELGMPATHSNAADDGTMIDENQTQGHSETPEALPPDTGSRSRKSRRRPKVPSGESLDPPETLRYPSETTLDESRKTLHLDADLYREVRASFAQICESHGVSKKTIAGPVRWEAAKERLIQMTPHLRAVMWTNKDNLNHKKLALDVICTDVTKRLRGMQYKMTIADAKNRLGSNPEESRIIRQDFLAILQGTSLTSKTQAGPEQWEDLKDRWIQQSTTLQKLLTAGATGSSYADKLKAADAIASDVLKRLRDDQARKGTREPTKPLAPSARKSKPTSPATRAARQPLQVESLADNMRVTENSDSAVGEEFARLGRLSQFHHISSALGEIEQADQAQLPNNDSSNQLLPSSPLRSPSRAVSHIHQGNSPLSTPLSNSTSLMHSPSHSHHSQMLPSDVGMLDPTGLPIDPQIEAPLPVLLNPHTPDSSRHVHTPYLSPSLSQTQQRHHPHGLPASPFVPQHFTSHPTTPQALPPVAVYLRLHPSSTVNIASPVWIAMLTSRRFAELRQVVVKDMPGAICGRVEGILDGDMTIDITRDDELTAYLAVVEGRREDGGGPPTFYVHILWESS
jgi:hypothetical protein